MALANVFAVAWPAAGATWAWVSMVIARFAWPEPLTAAEVVDTAAGGWCRVSGASRGLMSAPGPLDGALSRRVWDPP